MKSNETTHYLYATVSSWRYVCDIPKPKKADDRTESRLYLDGVTSECNVLLEALPVGLCLVCNETEADSESLLSPWRVDLIPASDGELLIPKALEAVLTVSETSLRDFKECLFYYARFVKLLCSGAVGSTGIHVETL